MGGDEPGMLRITQRELLMEMRDDIRALRSALDSVARDQALSVEHRASMQRVVAGGRPEHEEGADAVAAAQLLEGNAVIVDERTHVDDPSHEEYPRPLCTTKGDTALAATNKEPSSWREGLGVTMSW
jgi:hypothetical protein